VITSGFGFPNAKVYLGHFAHRTRDVLEYYLMREPKQAGLARFTAFIQQHVRYGLPMYLLSDMVEDPTALAALRQAYGVSPADIRLAFGPGQLVWIASQDPGFRIMLFVPDQSKEKLFSTLAYSALTESDEARLNETAFALKTIAGFMSPEQKRRTAEVLRSSEYGVVFLHEGFASLMSPESQRGADARIAHFRELENTGEFHLRLGNIMRYLGLMDEVRREWTEAYRLSRDPALAANLAKLGAKSR
jgi:hypothetical protein